RQGQGDIGGQADILGVAQVGIRLGVAFGVPADIRFLILLAEGTLGQQGLFQGRAPADSTALEGGFQQLLEFVAIAHQFACVEARLESFENGEDFRLLGFAFGNFGGAADEVLALLADGQVGKEAAFLHLLNARFGHGEVKAQRAFDGDLQVAEVAVVEDFAGQHALVLVALFLAVRLDIGLDIGDAQALVVLEVAVNASQRVDMVGLETAVFGFAFAELLAFVAQAFFHFPGEVAGVDQLHLAFALVAFAVGDDPDIGGDAGVVEQLVGQADHGLQPVVLDDPAANIALSAAGVTGKQRRAVEHHGNARAFARLAAFVFAGYALAEHVLEKQQGAIVDARQAGAEAAVEAELVVLLSDVVLLGLPF